MGFILMWIEVLAASLLFVALMANRLRRSVNSRGFVLMLTASLAIGGITFMIIQILTARIIYAYESLSWAVVAALLAAGILFFLARRGNQEKKFSVIAACLTVLAALLPVGLAAGGAIISHTLNEKKMEPSWQFYMMSLAVVLAAGTALVLAYGWRRKPGESAPRCQTWASLPLALSFAGVLGLLGITFWNMNSAVKESLAILRTESTALALSVAPTRIPDYQNAAIAYEKAFAAMPNAPQMKQSEKWMNGFSKPDFDVSSPDFKDYLAQYRATLAYVHKAAALPACYFERNYGQMSFGMILPELAKLRQCARVLAADARGKAAAGDTRGACEDIAVMTQIAAHQMQDPLLISFLVGCAIESIAKDALEGVLVSSAPTVEDLEALLKKMDELCSFRHAYQRALVGEEAAGLAEFAMLGSGDTSAVWFDMSGGGTQSGFAWFAPIWRVFIAEGDVASYRQKMLEMRNAAVYSSAGMYESTVTISKSLEENTKGCGLLTGLIIPCITRAGISCLRADAGRVLSLLALGMTAYRVKNGKYPEKLDELAPEFIPAIPLDPFDNKPLKIERRGTEILLYTIGDENKPLPQKLEPNESWRVFKLKDGTAKTKIGSSEARPSDF